MAMTLALIAAFARSYPVYDMAAFALGGRQFMIQSMKGYVKWSGWSPRGDESHVWIWESVSFIPDHDQWKGLIVRQLAIDGHWDSASWLISYWSIIIPLILLSAYLILWKPRKMVAPDSTSTISDQQTTLSVTVRQTS